jgi:hypothetical protein
MLISRFILVVTVGQWSVFALGQESKSAQEAIAEYVAAHQQYLSTEVSPRKLSFLRFQSSSKVLEEAFLPMPEYRSAHEFTEQILQKNVDGADSVITLMEHVVEDRQQDSERQDKEEQAECEICLERKVERYLEPCYYCVCSVCEFGMAAAGCRAHEDEDDLFRNPFKQSARYGCPVCNEMHAPSKPLRFATVSRKSNKKPALVPVVPSFTPREAFLSYRSAILCLFSIGEEWKSVYAKFYSKNIVPLEASLRKLLWQLSTANVTRINDPPTFLLSWQKDIRLNHEKLHSIVTASITNESLDFMEYWLKELSSINSSFLIAFEYSVEKFAQIWKGYNPSV